MPASLAAAALAALGIQAAGGALTGLARQNIAKNQAENKALIDMLLGAAEAGQPAVFDTPELARVGKRVGIGPDTLGLLRTKAAVTEAQRTAQQVQAQRTMQDFLGLGGAPAGPAPAGGPPAAGPSAVAPSVAGPAPAAPALQPRPSRTLTVDPVTGKTSMSATAPGVTELDIAREQREGARFGLEQERAGREAETFRLEQERRATELVGLRRKQMDLAKEDVARAQIADLMRQSAATDNPDQKRRILGEANAVAAGAGLNELAKLIQSGMPQKGPSVDLGIPHEAEFVASTGKNPKTMEPVDDATHKAALKVTADREARKEAMARSLTNLRQEDIGKRVAVTGAVRGLQKDLDDVSTHSQRVRQIEGALKTMEDHLNVYPKTVPGILGAQIDRFTQTVRGQDMRTIEQAINILQSAEARFMAGEKGRLPNQLEQQWRAVLADPTKMTQATAKKLIASTRQRLRDMDQAKEEAVKSRGRTAQRLGVPKPVVDAFLQGDSELLKGTFDQAMQGGVLPPAALPGDFQEVK